MKTPFISFSKSLQKRYRLCELCNLFGHKILFMKASGLGLTQNGKDWFNMGETRQMDFLKFYTKTGFLQVDVIMSYYGICLKKFFSYKTMSLSSPCVLQYLFEKKLFFICLPFSFNASYFTSMACRMFIQRRILYNWFSTKTET